MKIPVVCSDFTTVTRSKFVVKEGQRYLGSQVEAIRWVCGKPMADFSGFSFFLFFLSSPLSMTQGTRRANI